MPKAMGITYQQDRYAQHEYSPVASYIRNAVVRNGKIWYGYVLKRMKKYSLTLGSVA